MKHTVPASFREEFWGCNYINVKKGSVSLTVGCCARVEVGSRVGVGGNGAWKGFLGPETRGPRSESDHFTDWRELLGG